MKSEKGFSLIEMVIAVALLGIIGVGILSALGTASKALFITDERESAKNLAESQMEYVKEQVYAPTGEYKRLDCPDDYSITITKGAITSMDSDIQKITVTIMHQGKEVTRLEGYKGK